MKNKSKILLTIALVISILINIILLISIDMNTEKPLKESEVLFINDLIKTEIINVTEEEITISMENTTEDDYIYGSPYYFEIKQNDIWYVLEFIDETFWTSEARLLNSGDYVEETNNFSTIYGKLEKGTYRIVKNLTIESDIPITNNSSKYVMAEFEIK